MMIFFKGYLLWVDIKEEELAQTKYFEADPISKCVEKLKYIFPRAEGEYIILFVQTRFKLCAKIKSKGFAIRM